MTFLRRFLKFIDSFSPAELLDALSILIRNIIRNIYNNGSIIVQILLLPFLLLLVLVLLIIYLIKNIFINVFRFIKFMAKLFVFSLRETSFYWEIAGNTGQSIVFNLAVLIRRIILLIIYHILLLALLIQSIAMSFRRRTVNT